MHILDGLLPVEVLAGGFVAAAALTAATSGRLAAASAPRVAMATSAFFVASTLSFTVPPGARVHLSLLALAGVVLGRAAFPAVLVGVTLQMALFGHGGWSTLGVNATTMGAGALVAAAVFRAGTPLLGGAPVAAAALAGALGTLAALTLYGGALLSAGSELRAVAYACLIIHAPIVFLEAALTAAVVRFLLRVQPELVGFEPAHKAARELTRDAGGKADAGGAAEVVALAEAPDDADEAAGTPNAANARAEP